MITSIVFKLGMLFIFIVILSCLFGRRKPPKLADPVERLQALEAAKSRRSVLLISARKKYIIQYVDDKPEGFFLSQLGEFASAEEAFLFIEGKDTIQKYEILKPSPKRFVHWVSNK